MCPHASPPNKNKRRYHLGTAPGPLTQFIHAILPAEGGNQGMPEPGVGWPVLWWSIFNANSTVFRITRETNLWAWGCFQRGLTEWNGKTHPTEGSTIPWLGVLDRINWRRSWAAALLLPCHGGLYPSNCKPKQTLCQADLVTRLSQVNICQGMQRMADRFPPFYYISCSCGIARVGSLPLHGTMFLPNKALWAVGFNVSPLNSPPSPLSLLMSMVIFYWY